MSDLIRREDAIKALRLEYPMMPLFKAMREEWALRTEGFRRAEEVIMRLPSADRPRGEWKVFDAEDIGCYNCKCDACGEKFFIPLRKGRVPYYFCPNCGARMKGADDEVR